jgi:hypothetical protein
MSLNAQSKFYFIAAALFVIAAAIGYFERGVELKTAAGLIMAVVLVTLGIRWRRTSAS